MIKRVLILLISIHLSACKQSETNVETQSIQQEIIKLKQLMVLPEINIPIVKTIKLNEVENPFVARVQVRAPLSLTVFLKTHWQVLGYIKRQQHYTSVYLLSNGRQLSLFSRAKLFHQQWLVRGLDLKGVVLENIKTGELVVKKLNS